MRGTLFLCGAGNSEGVRLALAVNRAHSRWERIVLLDDDPAKRGERKLGVEVVGALSELLSAERTCDAAVNLVARTTAGRRAVRERILASGVPIAPLVSSDVDIEGVELATDVIVYRHATLGPESVIRDGAVVFMGAVIGHESVVGEGCVVAANAVLNARVRLDEGVYVGSAATIIPELRIGAWATVGAGSLVLQEVAAGETVLGVPAAVVHCRDDGRALPWPSPSVAAPAPGARSVSALKLLIAEAWSAVLGPGTNVDVSFFDAGGTSLCAMHVRERLMASAGITLAVTDLYRFPTVRSLAEHLARGEGSMVTAATERAAARRAVRHPPRELSDVR